MLFFTKIWIAVQSIEQPRSIARCTPPPIDMWAPSRSFVREKAITAGVIPRLAERAEGPHISAGDYTLSCSVIHSSSVRSLAVFARSGRQQSTREVMAVLLLRALRNSEVLR